MFIIRWNSIRFAMGCVCAALFATSNLYADPGSADAQRLQLQRQQQQNELQLKMQQQYERATMPPSATVNEQLQRNQLELNQRWRQQVLQQEQRSRESALQALPPGSARELQQRTEAIRAQREGEAQLQQFRWESRTQSQMQQGETSGRGDANRAR